MPNWMALQAANPEPSILDAIEFAAPEPAPKRRVRIVHDSHPEDPRTGFDLMCQIDGDFSWRHRPRNEFIAGLIRDTQAWRVVEQMLAAADPDWTDGDGPDLEGDDELRQQWLDRLTDCLLVEEFDTQSYSYVAHTTPEMCAKLGVEWEHAKEAMAGEVKLFRQWAEGDVYGYVVEEWRKECDCDDCEAGEWEEIDSCWGFYGSDPFENGMSEHIDEDLHDQLRRAEPEY